jgi:hypothetical protein
MDEDMIATHLGNLDRRLANVEQILPTLATKEELKTLATKEELKTLATREELKTLATREELHATEAALRAEIRGASEESRRHMTMLIEHQDTKLQLIAEHVLSLMDKRR